MESVIMNKLQKVIEEAEKAGKGKEVSINFYLFTLLYNIFVI